MTEHEPGELGRSARTPGQGGADHAREMGISGELDRTQAEAVLGGDSSGLPAGLVRLVAVVAALRARAVVEPVPPMSGALRSQITEPRTVVLTAARSARRALVLAAAAAVAVALFGIAAAQNRLPGELQDVVSSTAELVGIEVPSSEERGHAGQGDGGVGTAPGAGDLGSRRDEPAHQGSTPGGATPADPGQPGAAATPATPPEPTGEPEVDAVEKADKVEKVDKVDKVEVLPPAGEEDGADVDPAPSSGPESGSSGASPGGSQPTDPGSGDSAVGSKAPRDAIASEPSVSAPGRSG